MSFRPRHGQHLTLVLGTALLVTACGLRTADGAKPAPATGPARAHVGPPVEEHFLSNGMKLLLVPRHISPTVSGGWVAHVGSANERPGITGISHLFEHMMFKGTHVIGTRDYETDARLIDEQERVQDEMRAEISKLRLLERKGEIEDFTKPEAKTPRYRALEARFDSLVAAQRANMVKNEFDVILSRNGGTGMNASTNPDMTFYYETLPSNRLELWFWMEADRIRNRVFREFYSERDVVYEERRRSLESTPTGKFQESFDAVFWDASPYSWSTLGWPSDVAMITKAQADAYYGDFYAPENLTALLVGDFDPGVALKLAEAYLGSIPRGTRPVPEMITKETRPLAEKRFYGEAETNPAVTIRWHTVAYEHRDVPALRVVREILDFETGRLRKSLVLSSGIATRASASSDTRKYEGAFEIQCEAKAGHSPEELEQAIYAEIDRLKNEAVPADELEKAKNHYATTTLRQLGTNMSILSRYARADGQGEWRDADRIDDAVERVTPDDVRRVAGTYFTKESRAVAIWTRKGGSEDRFKNLPN